MRRIIKILGITMVLAAILVISVAGPVFATGGNADKGNKGEERPYGECVCGDCVPNDYSYKWGYSYE